MRIIPLLPAFLFLLLASAHAQDVDTVPHFTLLGRVLDYTNDAPVAAAVVEVRELDRHVFADSAGHFAIRELPEGRYTFVTSRLGYITNEEPSEVREGNVLIVRLLPKPIVLEGLEVTASRLETRRKAVGFSSLVDGRHDLLDSTAPNVARYLWRHQVYLRPCPWQESEFGTGCATIRGRPRTVRVYIDDMLAPGGPDILYHYRPDDLYRVEVYRSLGMIRIYTPWYIEWVAKSGGGLPALCIVC